MKEVLELPATSSGTRMIYLHLLKSNELSYMVSQSRTEMQEGANGRGGRTETTVGLAEMVVPVSAHPGHQSRL